MRGKTVRQITSPGYIITLKPVLSTYALAKYSGALGYAAVSSV